MYNIVYGILCIVYEIYAIMIYLYGLPLIHGTDSQSWCIALYNVGHGLTNNYRLNKMLLAEIRRKIWTLFTISWSGRMGS